MTAQTTMAAAPAMATVQPSAGDGLLSRAEQLSLGLRLTLSLIAGGCLILSTALQFLAPSQRDVAELVAGGAASAGHDAGTHPGGAFAARLAGGHPGTEQADPGQDAPLAPERRGRGGE